MSETPVKFIDIGDVPVGYWQAKNKLMPITQMSKGHLQSALKSLGQVFKQNHKRYEEATKWQSLSRYRILTDEQYLVVVEKTKNKRNELLVELNKRK